MIQAGLTMIYKTANKQYTQFNGKVNKFKSKSDSLKYSSLTRVQGI